MSKRKLDDGNATEDRGAKLAADVKALNTAFSSWISSQSKDKPAYFWDKACIDYIAHVNSLKEEYADVLSAKKQQPAPTTKAPAPTLSSPPGAATTTATTTTPSFSMFAASTPAATPAAPATTFSFGNAGSAQAAAAPTPSFFGVTSSSGGSPPAALSFSAAAPSTGFSFMSASAPNFAPAGPSAAHTADGGSEGGAAADEAAEVDASDKFDSKVQKDESTTTLFQANARVHVKQAGGTWEARGTGSLTVRETKAAKRPFLLLSTDAGRALLTAVVPKGCQPNVPAQEGANEKTRVRKLLVGMLVASQDKAGGAPKLMTLMISVSNAEKRDELQRLLIQLGGKS